MAGFYPNKDENDGGAGSSGDGAILDGVSSSIKATVFDYTNANPLAVVLRDTNGDYVSVGGGTQYAEDAAHSSGHTGTLALAVRRDDASANYADTDGDYEALATDGGGNLRVVGTTNHDAVDSRAPIKIGGYASAAAPSDVSGDADRVNAWFLRNGAQATVITAAGALIGGDATNGLDVDVTRMSALVTGDATVGRVKLTDGTDVADILDLTNSNPLTVAIVDGSGDQITSFGGGTQYTEDATAAANPVGTALNLIRDDARGGSLTTTDGDNVAARGTNAGELYVKHVDTIAVTQSGTWDEVGINDSGNSITVDNPQLSVVGSGTEATALRVTIASDSTGVLSVDDNGSTLSIDDGGSSITVDGTVDTELTTADLDTGAGTDTRAVVGLVLAESGGGLLVGSANPMPISDNSGSITVDNSGTFAVQESGSALTALQLIDDIVYTDDTSTHSTGSSKGALIMAAATPTDGSVNANDIGAVAMTVNRELHVSLTTALPAGTNGIGKLTANSGVDIGDVDVTSIIPGTGATNLGKAEDGGHTTGDVGVFALGVRVDTPNTALTNTDADYSPIAVNKLGSVRHAPMEDDLATAATSHVKKYYTSTGAVTDGIVWSPAAGKRWFLTHLSFNVSAACTVTFEDDLAAGDSAVYKGEFAANSGAVLTFPEVPMFSGEDAADLLVTTSAGNIYVTAVGYEI